MKNLIAAPARKKPRLPRLIVCADCGNRFDPRDERADVDKARPDQCSCPACAILRRATRAWCVTNDCNGLFRECVRSTESEAAEMRDRPPFRNAGCRVVPVVVVPLARIERFDP